MRIKRCFLILITITCVCVGQTKQSPESHLPNLISGTRWISYAPTNYYPREFPPVRPDDVSLRADLMTLHQAGFTGLVSYGAELADIPRIAEEIGFKAMLLGIWDPDNPVERSQAVSAVREHRKLIAGLIVGNEGLQTGRYDIETLCRAIDAVRQATGKPISTTESVDWILSEPKIASCSNFVTVNAHSYFSNHKTPKDAVNWTTEAWRAVQRRYPGKPLLFKEVGLPSAGEEGLSEESQKEYYELLSKTPVTFSYFEAFDASPRFKDGRIEQSWGLWRANRTPKAVVEALPWRTKTH